MTNLKNQTSIAKVHNLEYREMTLENLEEMAEMYVETFNAPPWKDHWTKETATKRLKQMINVLDFYGLCAYDEGVLCGMILGGMEQYCHKQQFNIKEFCVNNKKRGRGTGTKLYNAFEERLKAKGVDEVILITQKGNLTEGFYKKQDFKTDDGLIIMEKKL